MRLRIPTGFVLLSFLLWATSAGGEGRLAITGGTIIDVSGLGQKVWRISPGTVLIESGQIVAVGPEAEISIPEDVRTIHADGQFIIPGLIDGFAVLNNQAYANAFLYMGVTSIIGVSGGRRGPLYEEADPSPTIFRLEDVGAEPRSDEQLLRDIRRRKEEGVRVLLLMYGLTADQLPLAVQEAHRLGMATIGELGRARYADGIAAGIDAFVHTTRYSMDAAPDSIAQAVAKQPFSDDLQSPKWRYYIYLTHLDLQAPRLLAHARRLGAAKAFLMPTLSLLYLDLRQHKNPWNFPVARLLKPETINNPANRKTGNHDYDAAHQAAYTALAQKVLELERLYRRNGAKYLAGSATDVWGTMPGISLHTELQLLHEVGLSIPEVLAAVTSNFRRAFGWRNVGRVAPGCQADLLILDKNPIKTLENLRSIDKIVLRGRVIQRESLLRNTKP